MSSRSKSEKIVRDIKRHTRRKYTSEVKISTEKSNHEMFMDFLRRIGKLSFMVFLSFYVKKVCQF